MGGRRFFAARLFCGHTRRRWAVRRIYRPLRENRPACRRGAFWTFFCPLNPIPGADHAPPGVRSMPRAVLATDAVLLQGGPQCLPDRMPVRGMGARAFSPAGLCAMIPPGGYGDAGRGLYKRSGDTPVSECRRRVGPSARCPSHSVCSQSAVLRRPLLRQKEEKVLQLPFCSAAASTSSGRFAKKSKPVSRSISSTETT